MMLRAVDVGSISISVHLLRIENAVSCIQVAESPISDLAYNLGFSSQGNFSRFSGSTSAYYPSVSEREYARSSKRCSDRVPASRHLTASDLAGRARSV
jgi:AraC-like DNA-binding protein